MKEENTNEDQNADNGYPLLGDSLQFEKVWVCQACDDEFLYDPDNLACPICGGELKKDLAQEDKDKLWWAEYEKSKVNIG